VTAQIHHFPLSAAQALLLFAFGQCALRTVALQGAMGGLGWRDLPEPIRIAWLIGSEIENDTWFI